MKQLSTYLLLNLIFLSSLSYSQPWMRTPLTSNSNENVDPDNYYNIKQKFNQYWESHPSSDNEHENAEEGGFQQFKRWQHFIEPRVYPSGKLPDPEILIHEYQKSKTLRGRHQIEAASTNWEEIGPGVVPGGGGGAGRLNVITFHPTDPNTFYVGAACGGVWKTTDGGSTWNSNSDFLSAIGVADIAINARYPDSIYIATGDGHGYEVGNDFWGGTYSAGIMLSTDGGQTYSPIGLSYQQSQSRIIQRMVIHPLHPETLIATTRTGIWQSTNAGVTWTNRRNGGFYDIEFNVSNPDIVYTANNSSLFISSDGGATWNQTATLGAGDRISLAVTASNPDVIYAFCAGNQGLYKSVDGGSTFVFKQNMGGVGTFYGYWDTSLDVSPTNENVVFCGGLDLYKSTNGGTSFTTMTSWSNWGAPDYVHADQKRTVFKPGSGTTIFATNDGGLFRSDDGGNNWVDLSEGLAIKQYYRLGVSQQDAGLIVAGAQDNGTDLLKNGVWEHILGGDGMDCAVNPQNDNRMIYSLQYGSFSRTANRGNSNLNVSTNFSGSGAWVTPVVYHPITPSTLYIANTAFHRSTNDGSSFTQISSDFALNLLEHIAVAPSNPDVIYVCNAGEIYRSTDGGFNFSSINNGLPNGQNALSWIAVSNTNPDHAWVTVSGYSAGLKAYKTINGGQTWTNISGTLPNVPANCIVYQDNSNDALYLGTDFGVYYLDNNLTDWIVFGNGFPNVVVSELEIMYGVQKLRAATFGRGIWEIDLNTNSFFALDAGVTNVANPVNFQCATNIIPELTIKNFGGDTLTSLTINYIIDGGGAVWQQNWSGSLPTQASEVVQLPSIPFTAGPHILEIYTTNPNGNADQNPLNDTKVTTFNIADTLTLPIIEGFESGTLPIAKWTQLDNFNLLSITNTASGFGNSTQCLKANLFNNQNEAILTSAKLDFNNITLPARMRFNVANARNNNGLRDSLIIRYSVDCGVTWSNLFRKGGTALSTVGVTTTAFVPTSSQWRAELVDLNSLAGNAEVLLQFIIKGGANNLYLDDINIQTGTTSLDPSQLNDAVSIYPNPANNELNFNFSEDLLVKEIHISDLAGRLITTEYLQSISSTHVINLANYSNGMYMIQIKTNNGLIVKPIFIQHN
ncbi:MAG: hypothetical protein RIQ89_1913 [Bacteroidota bacterium]